MNFKNLTLVGLCLAIVLAGCNTDVTLDPLPSPATIFSFKASAGVVTKGAKITLDWNTADAQTVEIDQVGVGLVSGIDNKSIGTAEVTIHAASLFVLSAINARGAKATALVTVGVEGGTGKASFAAVPGLIAAGESATLVWNAPGAKSIRVTPMGGSTLDLKGQGDLGTIEVKPLVTTVYTLNADGSEKQATVKVSARLSSFTASKSIALPAELVTVSWKTAGATKVIVSTPGRAAAVTETDPMRMADGMFTMALPDAPLGTVVPFTIRVEGSGSPQVKTVTVVLANAPVVKTFSAPEYARTGQKFPVSWHTLNADTVELSIDGIVFWASTSAAEAASGTLLVNSPSVTTQYVLAAKNSLGGPAVTQSVTLKPIDGASVTRFAAIPPTVPAGGTAVTLTWNVANARRVKIVDSDGHTVATARGTTAQMGSAMAYPNKATTYRLEADNTVELPVTATQTVTVTTPAAFGPLVPAAAVFAANPVSLNWTVGTNAELVGFPHTDIVAKTASTGFVDISTTGARLALTSAQGDEATITFEPTDFESFIFGNRVSGPVTVSTNGFFAFSATAKTRSGTTAIPNMTIERNFIAPFWADLEVGPVGNIYWGVLNEAPERTLIVQFDKVKVVGQPASELTFQAKVHQTGVVTFEYKKISSAALPTHVIGVQGAVEGVTAGGAGDNVGLTLFGPKPSPLATMFASAGGRGGFIKLSGGYLKAVFAPSPFVGKGAISITEVMYQPNAAIADTGEWFEVANSLPIPVDLNGWTINFGTATHDITTSAIVPANGTLLLGQLASSALNDAVATGYQYGTTFSMPQPAGSVALRVTNYTAIAAWNSANLDNGGEGVSIRIDPNLYLVSTDTATTPPHSNTCSSIGTFGAQVPLQKGSPGAIPTCFSYRMHSIPVSYLDISATGTLTTIGDDVVGTVDVTTAPVFHFGIPQDSLWVSTNGWLTFRPTADAAYDNRVRPSASVTNSGTMAVFWDDLANKEQSNSGVFSKRIAAGVDPNNPIAHWIIQWSHYRFFGGVDDLNFQVKLFDNAVIEYHYASMTSGALANFASGFSATVWLENVGGTKALISSVNRPLVEAHTAWRFTPN